jgi:CheY-like chemotaxis protein
MARLLLIDDNEANRFTLSALLESEAFELAEASCLAEAHQLLATAAPFDLILLDRQLGDGLGLELIPFVRARLPACKIIVVSGDARGEDRAAAAADAYFRKGEDLDELFETIRSLLVTGHAARSAAGL